MLAAAKRVNPKARLIIKYPQWYDQFHERGYEVLRETADFDRTWVGTETRDYQRPAVGRHAAVRGLLHHALAGRNRRPEMRRRLVRPLRHDRADLPGTGPADRAGRRPRVDALLLRLALGAHRPEERRDPAAEHPRIAGRRRSRSAAARIVGVAAYKPANSHPENEQRVFDFVGMLGLPLVPCHEFPAEAKAAFFSVHALKDPDLPGKLAAFIAAGKPVLLTDGLAKRLGRQGGPRRAQRSHPCRSRAIPSRCWNCRRQNWMPCGRRSCAPWAIRSVRPIAWPSTCLPMGAGSSRTSGTRPSRWNWTARHGRSRHAAGCSSGSRSPPRDTGNRSPGNGSDNEHKRLGLPFIQSKVDARP